MKLKVVKKITTIVAQEIAPDENTLAGKLPPDTYQPMLPPRVLQLDSNNLLVLQVRRGGDEGLPEVDIRTKTKNKDNEYHFTRKGFTFPVEVLEEFSDTCLRLFDDVEEHNILEDLL